MQKLLAKALALVLAGGMIFSMTALAADETAAAAAKGETAAAEEEAKTEEKPEAAEAEKAAEGEEAAEETEAAEPRKPKSEGGALELTVYHYNDSHAREGEAKVDYAKVSGQVKAEKAAGKNVLLLDGGDSFHGRPIANLYKGYSVVQIFNTMGIDALAPGNHDFNYGWQRLLALSAYADFPVLSANVVKGDKTPLLGSYIIREFDGYKVGIFGLTTPETTFKSHPNNTKGLTFVDPIKSATDMTNFLKSANCDYIICLGHIGLDEATDITSEDICNAVPGIDLFVDGHSHTTLEEGKQTKNGLIVQANEYGNYIGEVTVGVTAEGEKTAKAVLLNEEGVEAWPVDEDTDKLIKAYQASVDEEIGVVIGKTDVDLVGEREVVRAGESNLGFVVTDALLTATGADIALTNGGGLRATIPAGDITYASVLDVLPFGNIVVTKTVTGADIKAALEQGAADYPEPAGGFLHIAGGTYTIDPSKPAGERVVEITIGGAPIDLKAEYTLATNDFLAAGGDESPLGNGSIKAMTDPMDQVVKEYIESDAFTIPTESRIIIVGGAQTAAETAEAEAPAAEKTEEAAPEATTEAAPAETEKVEGEEKAAA